MNITAAAIPDGFHRMVMYGVFPMIIGVLLPVALYYLCHCTKKKDIDKSVVKMNALSNLPGPKIIRFINLFEHALTFNKVSTNKLLRVASYNIVMQSASPLSRAP